MERDFLSIYQLQFTVSSCPYNLDNYELCEAMMVLDKTLIEILGSGLKFSYPNQVASGDPYCEIIIENK